MAYGPFGYHQAPVGNLAQAAVARQYQARRSRHCERLAIWAAADLGFRCLPHADQLAWFDDLARWAAGMIAEPPIADASRWVPSVRGIN